MSAGIGSAEPAGEQGPAVEDPPRSRFARFLSGERRSLLPWNLAFLGALSIRLLYFFEWRDSPFFTTAIGDGLQYLKWATSIAAGNWYGQEVFYQAPLYPYFLALLISLFGPDLAVPRVAQALLGAASCVLLGLATRNLFSRAAGLFVAFGLALYAPAVFSDGTLQKTSLATFLLCALLYVWTRIRLTPSRRLDYLIGLLAACLALAQEQLLVLIPILVLWFAVGDRPRWAKAASILALILGLATIFVPIGLRNQSLGGKFLITTSQFGSNFYLGNNPNANGSYQSLVDGHGDAQYEREDATNLAQQALGRPLTPAEVSSYWLSRSLDFITAEPIRWIKLTIAKVAMTWHRYEWPDTEALEAYERQSVLLRALALPFNFGVLVPLAAFGILATRNRWRDLWPLYLALLSITAGVALFIIYGRYRFPLVPILWMFAGAAAAHLVSLPRAPEPAGGRRSLYAGAIGAALLANVNWTDARLDRHGYGTEFSVGLRLLDAADYPAADGVLSRVVHNEPGSALSFFALSMAKRGLGQYDQQIALLRQGLRLDPAHAQGRRSLTAAMLGHVDRFYDSGQIARAVPYLVEIVNAPQAITKEEFVLTLARLAEIRAVCDAGLAPGAPSARELVERALSLIPDNPHAVLAAAFTDLADRQRTKAYARLAILGPDAGSRLSERATILRSGLADGCRAGGARVLLVNSPGGISPAR